jgi:hypothetical protein
VEEGRFGLGDAEELVVVVEVVDFILIDSADSSGKRQEQKGRELRWQHVESRCYSLAAEEIALAMAIVDVFTIIPLRLPLLIARCSALGNRWSFLEALWEMTFTGGSWQFQQS